MEATPLRAVGDYLQTVSALHGRTVKTALELYRASYMQNYTGRAAKTHLARFHSVIAELGDRPVESLSQVDGFRVMTIVMSRSVSKETKASIRSAWRSFCKWLLVNHGITEDISQVWPPIVVKTKDWVRSHADFSREEIARWTSFLRPEIRTYVWASCLTGQRMSNVLSWTWEEITPEKLWRIPAEKVKQDKPMEIPIVPQLWTMIEPRRGSKDLVLPGVPRKSRLELVLKAAGQKAGLSPRDCIPHNFRRTACRWLAEAGVTRDEAQALFGWSSQDVMLNHYWPKTTTVERWRIMGKL